MILSREEKLLWGELLWKLKKIYEARESLRRHFMLVVGDEIVLLELEPQDIDAFAALVEDEKEYLKQWLDEYTWKSMLDARNYIDASELYFLFRGLIDAGIWYRGQLVGVVALHEGLMARRRHNMTLGYWVRERCQGKGIVTQSVKALIDFAFEEIGTRDVIIHTWTENKRSRALAERLGFRQERILPRASRINGRVVDEVEYIMMREVWRAKEWA